MGISICNNYTFKQRYNPCMEFTTAMQAEFAAAQAARLAGNEGRARVCARRAAGIAARIYLERNNLRGSGGSAMQNLQALLKAPGLDPRLEQAVRNLITTVSREFTLPSGIDLVHEARTLIGGLP